MGSVEKPRISKATLDKKADSSLVSILKQSFNQLEKENKELKEQIQSDTIVYADIRKENANLIEENKTLKGIIASGLFEEPKELDDKWAISKTRMFVPLVIALTDGIYCTKSSSSVIAQPAAIWKAMIVSNVNTARN